MSLSVSVNTRLAVSGRQCEAPCRAVPATTWECLHLVFDAYDKPFLYDKGKETACMRKRQELSP